MELTLEHVCKACHGEYHGDPSLLQKQIENVTTDSRQVIKGSLFIALKGARADGHDFIESCLAAGAYCCLSERPVQTDKGAVIVVDSTFQALRDIAAYYRKTLKIPVIGITGSVGKTGTKDMVASVLSQKYKVHKTEKNYNNDIGLPQTILKIRPEHEIAVLEMGINHFGEMRVLGEIARPDVVVMTNVGPCHLENLIDLQGVLKAKSEVFDTMPPEGTAILNGDEPPLCEVPSVNGKPPVFFGFKSSLDWYADQYRPLGTEDAACVLHHEGHAIPVTLHAPGRHMVYHALAAAAVGHRFGLSDAQIAEGISAIRPENGRNGLIRTGSLAIIDSCYNANPVSMKGAVDILSVYPGRKVCILGDMFELGDDSKALHYSVGQYIAGKQIDLLITIGDLAKEIARGASADTALQIQSYQTKEALIKALPLLIRAKDTILLKASHGMHFEEIIPYLQSAPHLPQ